MAQNETRRRVRYWNVWWTLSVIFMAFAMVVAVLELFGVLKDVGIVLALCGVGLSLLFGLTGATRNSVTNAGEAVVTVVQEVGGLREDLRSGLQRIEHGFERGFERIARVLVDRLPPR